MNGVLHYGNGYAEIKTLKKCYPILNKYYNMKKNILREIFSGANGKLSAKRVIGGIAMAVALGCTIALVIRDGSNSVVENLLMTIFITSVSLLGLPAITSVWGSSKMSIGASDESTEQTPTPAPIPTPVAEVTPEPIDSQPVPNCANCPCNKKGTE